MIAVAALASTRFEPKELDKIKDSESIYSETYRNTVLELQNMRYYVPKIKFIYILRKTNDPDVLEFVADADSLNPQIAIDLNGDGKIDESDALTYPGDPYDISDFHEFKRDAFVQPFVDPELIEDQWGTILSGTAPIESRYSPDEQAKYVIGIDMDVSQYQQLINLALFPFLIFVVFLILVIMVLMFIVKDMWNKQIVQLAALDRQKDEIMSIVRHQLAAPIASLQWYTEMLLTGDVGKLDTNQKEHVTTMHAVTTNLADLVGMISEVSRIRLGLTKVERTKVDLAELFKDILDVIKPRIQEKHIHFTQSLPSSFPEAMLDKRLTRMPIENFLTNAVKYTPEKGKVTLTVRIENGSLFCEVKDTGCGIPKEEQKEIFGRLFRASNARASFEGNGLGLYVAKGAIESQGGKIWFTSVENKGSTFTFELPLKELQK
jgi:signal transduction histidine kinase